MKAGDKVRIGRVRVFLGKKLIDSVYTTVVGDNTLTNPYGPYLYWHPGDRWEYNNTAAGGYIGQVVTNAGTNNTEVWKTYGAISP
jgi:hypothetical protein